MKVIITALLGLILLSSPVLAQDLFQYEAIIEAYSDMSASYEEKFIFYEPKSDNFIMTIEGFPDSDINIKSPAKCEKEQKTWGFEIECDLTEVSEKQFSIVVKYTRVDSIEEFVNFARKWVGENGDYSIMGLLDVIQRELYPLEEEEALASLAKMIQGPKIDA